MDDLFDPQRELGTVLREHRRSQHDVLHVAGAALDVGRGIAEGVLATGLSAKHVVVFFA